MPDNGAQAPGATSTSRLQEVIEAQRELLAHATNIEETFACAAKIARRITGCETVAVFTLEGDWLVRRAFSGTESPTMAAHPRRGGSLVDLCYQSGEMQLCADADTDPRVDQAVARRIGVRSMLTVPLHSSRGIEGVLRAGSRQTNVFSADDAQLMQVVGGMIGAALELASIFQNTQKQSNEIQAALEESRRSARTHRLLFEENPTPMYICDPLTLDILRANAAAHELYGYSEEEFVALNVLALLPADDHERLRTTVAAADRGTRIGLWRHMRKDGQKLLLHVISRAFDWDGRATRLIILNDETQRRQTEETLAATQQQLMQADKMASIGQLAAGVAHEINNPIGYVHSNLGTLGEYLKDLLSILDIYGETEAALPADSPLLHRIRERKQKLDLAFLQEDLSALMRESREGITRVKQIVQNLKDFSHADANDEWRTADLHKGIDSTLNIVNNELKYKCTVVKEYGDLPEIECLPSQLNQVFMNLLVNAAHAIEGKGTITLRTGTRGHEVFVEIADSGCGISPENLKRIFEPFFTTKPIGKGTGLGLSLAYGIVKKHGGRIEVDSEPGKGTTFRVLLPQQRLLAAAA